MDSYDTISDLLVNLFNEIMDIEEKQSSQKNFRISQTMICTS